jgi:hypothetical protein
VTDFEFFQSSRRRLLTKSLVTCPTGLKLWSIRWRMKETLLKIIHRESRSKSECHPKFNHRFLPTFCWIRCLLLDPILIAFGEQTTVEACMVDHSGLCLRSGQSYGASMAVWQRRQTCRTEYEVLDHRAHTVAHPNLHRISHPTPVQMEEERLDSI